MNSNILFESNNFHNVKSSSVSDIHLDCMVDHIISAGGTFYAFLNAHLGFGFRSLLVCHLKNVDSIFTDIYFYEEHNKICGAIFTAPAKKINFFSKNIFIDILTICPLSIRNDVLNYARRYSTSFPDGFSVGDGVYLSRFAISDVFKGSGLATSLFNYFINLNSSSPIFLHVDRLNTRAKKFYANNGFYFMPDAISDMDFGLRSRP